MKMGRLMVLEKGHRKECVKPERCRAGVSRQRSSRRSRGVRESLPRHQEERSVAVRTNKWIKERDGAQSQYKHQLHVYILLTNYQIQKLQKQYHLQMHQKE